LPIKAIPLRSRTVDLDGTINFRQLGGYRARDGRRVRWGKLFRSEHLGFLSDDDLERLERLDLGCICDLRSARERVGAPDRVPSRGNPRLVRLEIDQAALISPATAERVTRPEATATDIADGMRESYRRLVSHCRDQFSSFMHLLHDGANLPLLVHCTGGKDRSGFAAAIVLSALGVPRRTVFHDYLLTNKLIARHREEYSEALTVSLRLEEEKGHLAPLFLADRLYLKESFAEIDRLYGSFDRYLQQGLSFGDDRRRSLQDRLLV
jgi:protein-tyrosine phosphatase